MNARYFSNYFVDLLMCLLWMLSSWRNKWSFKYVTDGYSHLVDSFSILWRDSYFYTSCNERSVDNYSSFDILPTYYSFARHLMMTCVILVFFEVNVKNKNDFFVIIECEIELFSWSLWVIKSKKSYLMKLVSRIIWVQLPHGKVYDMFPFTLSFSIWSQISFPIMLNLCRSRWYFQI